MILKSRVYAHIKMSVTLFVITEPYFAIHLMENDKDQIQCLVSNSLTPNSVPFGKTQQPELWDYADNVDTLQFLQQT